MDELLEELQLKKYKDSKLSLREVLCIRKEDEDRFSSRMAPSWSFLRKLIALDGTARSTSQDELEDVSPGFATEEGSLEVFEMASRPVSHSVHPSDVLCAVMHCSDGFLQQEIVTKLAMCQFAVPLLLPAGDGFHYTLMLWAMKDIVKRWRPPSLLSSRGFKEENITNISLPIFTFVRLGSCSLSKSKVLNKTLSLSHAHHDFFVYRDMECGYSPRTISEGLLEMSWYFPGGNGNASIFKEPIAVLNLHGDLSSNDKQFSFITKVSSAVFIFMEDIQLKHCNFLEGFTEDRPNYFFIICPPKGQAVSEKVKENLKKLSVSLGLKNNNFLVKDTSMNEAEIVKQIQIIMRKLTENPLKNRKLEDLTRDADLFEIQVDEKTMECQKGKKLAEKICSTITDVPMYKRKNLFLQGPIWKQITKNEKELCRMKKYHDADVEAYKSQLINQNLDLRKQQCQQELQDDMKTFLKALTELSPTEKLYFLKWMKFFLDNTARSSLLDLQEGYIRYSTNVAELQQIDLEMSESSLGIENFLRELGQMHEAKLIIPNREDFKAECKKLSGIAADLLLQGFPVELIDGDTASIPWQWITDVFHQVDTKTGGHCTMRVITVLGVQSTGKSTLLNTMFGLHFPVACGRCTRGAFMTLLNVNKDFSQELGCDFILLIDTEGLKAPELASSEDSYKRDNELATMVVGLSDITIVNMAMENSAEMKDILQIVIHAFLRMKEVGKKPNCQFVHQNVSDVSAHVMNIRHRKKLLENLNEMTKAAAKMEKLEGITSFNDVMDYDLNEHTHYIPGLWYGVPPMAPINTGYSEGILSLKRDLLKFMKEKLQKPQTIPTFLTWLQSLWNAVKHEKFIFSFRNSLVADAYDHFCMKYSELEWNFRRQMYNWMTESLNSIRNQRERVIVDDLQIRLNVSMPKLLDEEETHMKDSLNTYVEKELENAHLVKKYLENFLNSVKSLRGEIYEELNRRLWEAVYIQKTKCDIQNLKDGYSAKMEAKVNSLLRSFKNKEEKINERELETQFEAMWTDTVKSFLINRIPKHDVDQQMLQQLRREMQNKAGKINEQLIDTDKLSKFSEASFVMKDEHVDLQWYRKFEDMFCHNVLGKQKFYQDDYHFKTQKVAENLLDQCTQYIEQKVSTRENYHETFCQELLNMVNVKLQEKAVAKLHTTDQFELDLKLLILGRAAPKFQKMHDEFVQLNDPFSCLEAAKHQYLSIFKNVFQNKDECRSRAHRFCQLCLKPAIEDYVNNHLGKEIINDLLNGEDNAKYMSRTFFQHRVLSKLIEDNKFDKYVEYINNYERFVKKSILEFIKEKYGKPRSLANLQLSIVFSIIHKLKQILQEPQIKESKNVSAFLSNIQKILEKDLVMSQDNINLIVFQNSSPVSQFSADVESYLPEMGDSLITEMGSSSIESVLAKVTLKPEEELFKKVIGCGKQCPFCKVPCEAGCVDHTEHFATVHRPKGLGRYRFIDSNVLCSALCSTDVVTERSFRNLDTDWKPHPYKEYQTFYPDWRIQPDPAISASDYWKFIFKEFNKQFAKEYNAKPANLPKEWHDITKDQAIKSLHESYYLE
ncbi:up-regulator of cell proliferation-like [Hyperolius riggenbachi]|uniref:up-regulator of cell proliferation-like n=1 Tax=Hyperolius riggenbachi TaxID=752182 RepID=UPI0035A2619A